MQQCERERAPIANLTVCECLSIHLSRRKQALEMLKRERYEEQ